MRRTKIGLLVPVAVGTGLVILLWSPVRRAILEPSGTATRVVTLRTPVARVNSIPLTVGELEEELRRILPPTRGHGKVDEQEKSRLRQLAREELIMRELAYQKAKAMQLKLEPEELEATIQKIKNRFETEDHFQGALRAEQVTEKEFVHRIEKDLLLRQIHKIEIEDKVTVSESEVMQFYEENRATFVAPESVHLKQIVIGTTPDNGTAAEKKIQEVFQKLQAGESFEDLADRYSEDGPHVLGGEHGWVSRGQLAPEIEQAAFAAKPRTLVGPLQTSKGWHLLLIEERRPSRQLKFEEVREQIANTLRRKRLGQRKAEFARQLREGARIEYLGPP